MASSRSGAIVAPPPHGARTTNPPSDPSAPLEARASCPVAAKARRRCAPVLAGRARVERGHRPPRSLGAERADPRIRRAAAEAGRLQDPVRRLDLEPEPLVERPAGVGRDEDERPAAGGLGGVDRRLGQRHAEARAAPRRVDPDRADPGRPAR